MLNIYKIINYKKKVNIIKDFEDDGYIFANQEKIILINFVINIIITETFIFDDVVDKLIKVNEDDVYKIFNEIFKADNPGV